MKVGTVFTIYGIARMTERGPLGMQKETRIKVEGPNGSRSLGWEWTGETWKHTRANEKEALALCGERNRAEAERLNTFAEA